MKVKRFCSVCMAGIAATWGMAPLYAQVASREAAMAGQAMPVSANATYADLVDLADEASDIAVIKIRKQAILEPARSPGLRPGYARAYIAGQVQQPMRGSLAVKQSVRYLVDIPALSDGSTRSLKGEQVAVFAREVPGKPSDLQLVSPYAQIPASAGMLQQLQTILDEMAAPDAPPRVRGVRDIISVPGNLTGESETQLFLVTDSQEAPLVSIVRRPGMAPQWGVAWGELVDGTGGPPAPNTLAWHRLACSLPPHIPAGANLGASEEAITQARADYALILRALGPCPRSGIMAR
ncbi:MAG: hypothetical protein AB7U34_03560 [Novosphingobium sp.]